MHLEDLPPYQDRSVASISSEGRFLKRLGHSMVEEESVSTSRSARMEVDALAQMVDGQHEFPEYVASLIKDLARLQDKSADPQALADSKPLVRRIHNALDKFIDNACKPSTKREHGNRRSMNSRRRFSRCLLTQDPRSLWFRSVQIPNGSERTVKH